jgi:ubiquinone biosynthesis protein COQ4
MVATLAEVTGKFALENMHQTMLNDPTGRRILQDRPLVTKESVDIEKLKKMPQNTFGYGYAKFLNKHGFDPDGRAKVQYISNPDLAYVMTRYR